MIISLLVSGMLPMAQTASVDIARAEQVRLESCLAKTESQPEEAYEEGFYEELRKRTGWALGEMGRTS